MIDDINEMYTKAQKAFHAICFEVQFALAETYILSMRQMLYFLCDQENSMWDISLFLEILASLQKLYPTLLNDEHINSVNN